jgi:hypothetical protein
MRNLPSRPVLDPKTAKKLDTKQQDILKAEAGEPRKKRARKVFDQARPSVWFEPVIGALKSVSGAADVCPLQIRRQQRYASLRRDAEQMLAEVNAGTVSVAEARQRLAEWRSTPLQADVADYFLNGPGRAVEPFCSLLKAVGDTVGA